MIYLYCLASCLEFVHSKWVAINFEGAFLFISLKVPFFQKVRFVFQISQSPKKIIPKIYPELGRFEKRILLSEKKAPLALLIFGRYIKLIPIKLYIRFSFSVILCTPNISDLPLALTFT